MKSNPRPGLGRSDVYRRNWIKQNNKGLNYEVIVLELLRARSDSYN